MHVFSIDPSMNTINQLKLEIKVMREVQNHSEQRTLITFLWIQAINGSKNIFFE